MAYSESEFITEIRKGNEKALNTLYKMHYPTVERLVLSNSGTSEEAKDIYQEAFIAFHNKIKGDDFTLTCKISTYLYSVSRRLWLKRLNSRKRFPGRIEDFENYIEVDEDLASIEENEKRFSSMSEAMGFLGEPCRTLLEDFYIQTRTMEEIAEKFGYTNPDNAKNQKYKCLQRLKKIFFSKYSTKA